MIRKYLQTIFKKISYGIYIKIYGSIEDSTDSTNDSRIEVKTLKKENNIIYKVYNISKGRLYTDRIHNIAAIIDNKIIEGPSFQLKNGPESTIQISDTADNVVFEKGTPRLLRNLNGSVLSLLIGGAGNNNYWHWMYDVLPKFELCSRYFNLDEIDFFLLPGLQKKFQKQTLDCLNIPEYKRISSEKFRHIKAEKLIITDHPVLTTGNATKDIQNIPNWIIAWLKEKFVNKDKIINKKNKIYIDRNDKKFNYVSKRLIKNEEDIKKYLLKNNFILAKLHNMNFIDQVNLFYNAECVVGLHGGGFGNIVFCKPGTKIIELKSLTAGDVIKNLALKLKLNHNFIAAQSEGTERFNFPTQQGSIRIPINRLMEMLEN